MSLMVGTSIDAFFLVRANKEKANKANKKIGKEGNLSLTKKRGTG